MTLSQRVQSIEVASPVRDAVAITVPIAVAFAAAAYGAVEPWSELALLALVGVVAAPPIFLGVRDGVPRGAVLGVFAFVAFSSLAASQLVPLPAGVVGLVSPTRLASVARLLPEVPASLSLSYDADATWNGLRHVLLGTTVFFATAVSIRSLTVAKRLLLGLFVVGVAEATLAIAQQATRAEGIYWGTVALGGLRSGSFVNHSNFTQFLNLTIGASLALLLVRLSEDQQRGRQTLRYAESARAMFRRHGWLLIGMAVQGIAIAASHSRAGLAAMLASFVLVFALLARRRTFGRSVWALLSIPPIVFCSLMLLGFDSFFGRVDTLGDRSAYADRVELSGAVFRVALDHPVVGTGLGSHALAFPAYDTTESVAAAEQADNDYAQLLEETGLLGGGIALAFALIVGRSLFVSASRNRQPLGYAAYGIGYGLLAVAIQSFTDFGQRVPAVYLVTATLCGLAVAIPCAVAQRIEGDSRSTRRTVRSAAVVGVFGALFLVAISAATRDYRASQWWSIAFGLEDQIRRADWQSVEPADYLDLIAASEQAASLNPDNVEYLYWLNVYRWQGLELAIAASGGSEIPIFRESANRIVAELQEARRIGPIYGPLSTLEGQIRRRLGDEGGERLIAQGVELNPNDPMACFAAAAVALEKEHDSARDEAAYQMLEKAVRLDPQLFEEAAEIVLQTRASIEAATRLTEDDSARMRTLAAMCAARGIFVDAVDSLRSRADEVQQQRVEAGVASATETADLARRMNAAGDLEAAVTLYRKALAGRFNQVDWRLALVDVLTRLERFEEAHHEARICLRVQPQSEPARRRFESLVTKLPVK